MRKWLGLLLGYCLLSAVLCAQEKVKFDTLKTYQIDEVVITSSRKVSKDLIPVQLLSGKELEKLTVHSVADAIRYFSGVQIKDFGGIGGLKTVNIRSMGTNHVGVFYDGIELGNAQNGQIDLGRFSLDNMEAVSVYNGQRSAIFQSAKDFGSAGTVYLQSKVPVFKPGERFHLRGSFKTGSFGVVNPSLLWEQALSRKVSASLSSEFMHTTGRYKFRYKTVGGYDTTAVRKNGDVNSIRAEGGLYGKIEDGEWRSKAYFYKSERGLPGAMVRNKLRHEDRQWDTNFFVQGSVKKFFNGAYAMLVNTKYAYDYLHYLADPSKDESLMYTNNHYKQQEFYVSMANLWTVNRYVNLSLSADYQMNSLRADLYRFPFPMRHTLLVSAAGSLDWKRLKLQGSVLGTFVFDHVKADTVSMANKQEVTPTVVASVKPFRKVDLSVRGFYKNIFRMPTLNDLYYTFIGNIKLKPEYTQQYDLGLAYTCRLPERYWMKLLEVQADVYFNKVKNKIVAVPTSNQFRWTMMNLGEVEIRGLDVALEGKWVFPKGVSLDARLSYTYQRAQDFTDPEDAYYGDQIPYIPWNSGSLVLNASWKNIDLNYSFIYTGERYDQRANIPENYAPEWYTNDLSLSYRFGLGKVDYRVTLEANNIFNQQFEVVKCYPMPGTNFKLILSFLL